MCISRSLIWVVNLFYFELEFIFILRKTRHIFEKQSYFYVVWIQSYGCATFLGVAHPLSGPWLIVRHAPPCRHATAALDVRSTVRVHPSARVIVTRVVQEKQDSIPNPGSRQEINSENLENIPRGRCRFF